MATLTAIRQALAARLATISGLNTYAFPPGSIVEPAAIVSLAPGTIVAYDVAMSGDAHDVRFVILLLVSRADDQSGSDALDAYIDRSGTSSIFAVVQADEDLASTVSYAVVERARDFGEYGYNDASFYGCQFDVTVGI